MSNNVPAIRPTGRAGEFQLQDGRVIKLVEWREGAFYDTVTHAGAGAITAGTSLELFRDLTNKNLPHSNLKTARNIPAATELILNRIGVLICQAFSNTVPVTSDILKAAYAGTLTFKMNERLIQEGLLVSFQSGIGMTGSTTENAIGLVTTGIASAAAAPQLMVAQNVNEKDSLEGTIDFKSDLWITGSAVMPTLAGRLLFTVLLNGFIKKAQGA